jgi:hypothetical protein
LGRFWPIVEVQNCDFNRTVQREEGADFTKAQGILK